MLWQGQKESNPQPTDLESATLPIELYPYNVCNYIKRLARLSSGVFTNICSKYPTNLITVEDISLIAEITNIIDKLRKDYARFSKVFIPTFKPLQGNKTIEPFIFE